MELTDRVAMVTGGGGRLGRAIAMELSREGAAVAIVDSRSGVADAAAAELRAGGGKAGGVMADVSRADEVERAVETLERELGPIDVLVNAHGIFPNRPVLEMDDEEWDRVFAVNTKGSMLCCRAVARRLVARGAPGSIVNIPSGAATSARAAARITPGARRR